MRLRPWFVIIALGWCANARAADPKWEFGKQEETKLVVWKAVVNGGLVLNTGNANNLAFSAGASASRNDGKNKLQLDIGGTYARATIISVTPHDANAGTMMPPMLVVGPSDIKRTPQTTAALWQLRLRYDRFLTPNNSLYAAALASGNTPAGITVAAGAQAGYSRQALKTERHLLLAEIGYDYTFQRNVTPGPDLNIHSGRLFVGYALTLTKEIGLSAGLEVLCNLNPLPGYQPNTTVGPFLDTRINGNAAMTARLYKNIAFQVSFLAKYTTDPAPLAPFAAAPFQPGFVPVAEPLDTVTSLSLVVTLL